eukprot:gene8733-4699_t
MLVEGGKGLCAAIDAGSWPLPPPLPWYTQADCCKTFWTPWFYIMASLLLPLNSREGKQRLAEAVANGSGHQAIVDAWRPQTGSTCCGFASLAVVLTALKEGASSGESVHEDAVHPLAAADGGAIVADEQVRRVGMTLDQARQVPYGGHLSPIAAFHEPSDAILIMDVWYETEPVWATVETVWNAILGLDSESKKPRGLLVVTHQ